MLTPGCSSCILKSVLQLGIAKLMDNSQNSKISAQHVKKIQLLRENVEREWREKFGTPTTPNMVSDPKDITSIVTWILAEAIPEAELFMLLPHLTKIPKRLQP